MYDIIWHKRIPLDHPDFGAFRPRRRFWPVVLHTMDTDCVADADRVLRAIYPDRNVFFTAGTTPIGPVGPTANVRWSTWTPDGCGESGSIAYRCEACGHHECAPCMSCGDSRCSGCNLCVPCEAERRAFLMLMNRLRDQANGEWCSPAFSTRSFTRNRLPWLPLETHDLIAPPDYRK